MVLAAFGDALFLGCSEEGKQGVVDASKRGGGNAPGFRVSRGSCFSSFGGSPTDVYWTVTNTSDTPLKLTRVTYNGEWQAPRAELYYGGRVVYRAAAGLPVQLTIGEACHFLQYGARDKSSYTKDIIYIDIETDRGTFRYRPDEAHLELSKPLPMFKMPPSSALGS
jgi:hypothetical protein